MLVLVVVAMEDKHNPLDDRDMGGSAAAVGGGRKESKEGSLCVSLIFKCMGGGGEIGKAAVSFSTARPEVASPFVDDSCRDSLG
mmetsp:Transcript_6715/g.8167  ORF Transcript_6715/g.8167 Transcript_6715/m.8167 type:complete len:84 (+) Transcript_6715:220-471(+)